MLLIPEIRTVVITPPRTGSTSIRKAVMSAYPKTLNPYRHMEATGIPYGYDRWTKVCVIRNPYQRMWSLFKYMRKGGKSTQTGTGVFLRPERAQRLMADTDRSFEDWLLRPGVPFNDSGAEWGPGYDAFYCCHNSGPEQLKSQAVYAQPNAGTEIIQIEDTGALLGRLGLEQMPILNESTSTPMEKLSVGAVKVLQERWAWDLSQY